MALLIKSYSRKSKSSLKELRINRIADVVLDFISNIPAKEQEALVSLIKFLWQIKIELSDDSTISRLNKLLCNEKWIYDEYICDIAEALGKVNPGNQEAKRVLTELISKNRKPYFLEYAATRLEQIDPDNQDAINCLIRLLYLCENEDESPLLGSVVRTLGEICVKATSSERSRMLIAQELIFIFLAISDSYVRGETLKSLKSIRDYDLDMIDIFLGRLNTLIKISDLSEENFFIEWFILEIVDEINFPESNIINKLINLILNIKIGVEGHDIRKAAISLLGRVGSRSDGFEKLLITVFLVELLNVQEKEEDCLITAIALGRVDPESNQSITALVKLLDESQNKDFIIESALFLRVVGKNNRKAIDGLLKLLKRSLGDEVLRFAIGSLGEIAYGDLITIQTLSKFLEDDRKNLRLIAAENLFKITSDNSEYIDILLEALAIEDLEPSFYYDERGEIIFEPTYLELAMRIEELLSRNYNSINYNLKVINKISKCINNEVYKHNFSRYEACHWLVWHCSNTIKYDDFYRAWSD